MPQSTDVNELLDSMERLCGTASASTSRSGCCAAATCGRNRRPSQLENAIVNLAVNARDAMPEGRAADHPRTANVELDADHEAADPEIRAGPYVMVAVSDTGRSAIARRCAGARLRAVFTTRTSAREPASAWSMVYGFIKQTGGHVRIYRGRPGGTVVRCICRARTTAAIAVHAPAAKPAELPTGTEPSPGRG